MKKQPKPPRTDTMQHLGGELRRDVYFEREIPAEIWDDLAQHDLSDYRKLCVAMKDLVFHGLSGLLTNPLALYMYHFHYRRDGHFLKESDWFADLSDGIVTRAQSAMIQRMYTWAHAVGMGCTTCCIWDEEAQSMACFRGLDWDGARPLGAATRIYDFKSNDGSVRFRGAGIIGMVGLLTGVKPGFSLAINYLPWKKPSARYKTDPLFKLRQIMEDPAITTYDDALSALKTAEIGSPVCFTLCGISRNEACAIEVGLNSEKHIRFAEDGFLAQTNHFDCASPFSSQNFAMYGYPADNKGRRVNHWHDAGLLPCSNRRRLDVAMGLRKLVTSGGDIRKAFVALYENSPVWNFETAHWALMRPNTGDIEVWRRMPVTQNAEI